MRLIDVDNLKRRIVAFCTGCSTTYLTIDNMMMLTNQAGIVDAVPVVRCKDCVHWREAVTNEKGFLICPASGMEITESDFCSYGEREENNGVD